MVENQTSVHRLFELATQFVNIIHCKFVSLDRVPLTLIYQCPMAGIPKELECAVTTRKTYYLNLQDKKIKFGGTYGPIIVDLQDKKINIAHTNGPIIVDNNTLIFRPKIHGRGAQYTFFTLIDPPPSSMTQRRLDSTQPIHYNP